MRAGAARIDITPTENIWMDGMLRAHPSVGVHDSIYACALVMADSDDLTHGCAIVAADVCRLTEPMTSAVRESVESAIGIPADRIIVAAKHIHSGPVTTGGGEVEEAYAEALQEKLIQVVQDAACTMRTVKAGTASGKEATISEYRRLLAKDGRVVMNWEPYEPDEMVGPLGEVDPEVGVLKVDDLSGETICILFNHAGHPNVLSGDNYLISAEYPGFAERTLEAEFGGTAIFLNGAQGTMDIDGLGPRDWAEMERIGKTLATVVAEAVRAIEPSADARLRCGGAAYTLPARQISQETLAWAQDVLEETGGEVKPMADGVGEDHKAKLYTELHTVQDEDVPVMQVCISLDETAFMSFPGEMFTEIGMEIKARSPFERTYVVGLANGHVGYLPTVKAIEEGGYAVDVRRLDRAAEEITVENSLSLLEKVYQS